MNIFKKKMTLIAEVFHKLGSPKNKVGSISIESHLNLVEILNILKKQDDSHSWGISEITDSEKHGYIKV